MAKKPAKKGAAKKAAPKKAVAKVGRPSLFRDEFIGQAAKLCALGATDAELADFFDVTVATLNRWKIAVPEFCASIKVAKEAADDRVERSLYNRATGYSYDSEKIVTVAQGGGYSEVQHIPIREHVPPDVTAQIFWLKNRRKDDWRDRQQLEHTGKDGGAIETVELTPREIAQRAAFLLAKGAKAK